MTNETIKPGPTDTEPDTGFYERDLPYRGCKASK
jgi:hypothetical protein